MRTWGGSKEPYWFLQGQHQTLLHGPSTQPRRPPMSPAKTFLERKMPNRTLSSGLCCHGFGGWLKTGRRPWKAAGVRQVTEYKGLKHLEWCLALASWLLHSCHCPQEATSATSPSWTSWTFTWMWLNSLLKTPLFAFSPLVFPQLST